MRGARVVLLGEVHDNGVQHALRAEALRKLVQSGARPAIAFEQFDRGAQEAIDRARRERPGDIDYLIAQAKGAPSWRWEMYKPFIALALEYDLPIVAANLARADAMKTATSATAVDAPPRPPARAGGSGAEGPLRPASARGDPRHGARAGRARPHACASDRAHAASGVVLLTGNGHARKDMGVAHWLAGPSTSIALVEDDEDSAGFDYYVVTERAQRPDPCEELRKRLKR